MECFMGIRMFWDVVLNLFHGYRKLGNIPTEVTVLYIINVFFEF